MKCGLIAHTLPLVRRNAFFEIMDGYFDKPTCWSIAHDKVCDGLWTVKLQRVINNGRSNKIDYWKVSRKHPVFGKLKKFCGVTTISNNNEENVKGRIITIKRVLYYSLL